MALTLTPADPVRDLGPPDDPAIVPPVPLPRPRMGGAPVPLPTARPAGAPPPVPLPYESGFRPNSLFDQFARWYHGRSGGAPVSLSEANERAAASTHAGDFASFFHRMFGTDDPAHGVGPTGPVLPPGTAQTPGEPVWVPDTHPLNRGGLKQVPGPIVNVPPTPGGKSQERAPGLAPVRTPDPDRPGKSDPLTPPASGGTRPGRAPDGGQPWRFDPYTGRPIPGDHAPNYRNPLTGQPEYLDPNWKMRFPPGAEQWMNSLLGQAPPQVRGLFSFILRQLAAQQGGGQGAPVPFGSPTADTSPAGATPADAGDGSGNDVSTSPTSGPVAPVAPGDPNRGGTAPPPDAGAAPAPTAVPGSSASPAAADLTGAGPAAPAASSAAPGDPAAPRYMPPSRFGIPDPTGIFTPYEDPALHADRGSPDATSVGPARTPVRAASLGALPSVARGYGRASQAAMAGAANYNFGQPFNANLAAARAPLLRELQLKPWLREKLIAIMYNEQGSNPQGVQGIVESAMNRALVRGTSLEQQLRWHKLERNGYYAPGNMGRNAHRYMPILNRAIENAGRGSNLVEYATDNASGEFANRRIANGMFRFRKKIHGETFSVPGYGHGAELNHARNWDSWMPRMDTTAVAGR